MAVSAKSVCKQKNKPFFIVRTKRPMEHKWKAADENFLFGKNCLAKPMSARIEHNVLRLPVVGVWNTQLSITTNGCLKIQNFLLPRPRQYW
jgi:hypothetical protein